MLQYKTATLLLLLITPITVGGTSLYYQQRVTELSTELSDSKERVSDLNNQLSNLSNDLQDLTTQLSNQNTQLTSEIEQLQSQLDKLTQHQTNTTLISNGTLYLAGYGAALYVPFTVSIGVVASLNISFAASAPIVTVLLNQTQYDDFLVCNCVHYGNYTETTWTSPVATSYRTAFDIPEPGSWYFAFIEQPGTGSERTITETLLLIKDA